MIAKVPLTDIPDDELWFEYDLWVNAATRREDLAASLRNRAEGFHQEALDCIGWSGSVLEEIRKRGVER